uniref:Uncharacterized protein n=1 Tax=Trichuris muris TaxID=70415 RepID=A0A5S6R5G0_TRIMR
MSARAVSRRTRTPLSDQSLPPTQLQRFGFAAATRVAPPDETDFFPAKSTSTRLLGIRPIDASYLRGQSSNNGYGGRYAAPVEGSQHSQPTRARRNDGLPYSAFFA